MKPHDLKPSDQLSFTQFKVAEITLIYSNPGLYSRPKISGSEEAYKVLKANWSDQMEFIEEFNLLVLDRANRALAFHNISKGGFNGTFVDLKVIFAAAILAKGSSILVAHNHPSQQLKPSTADMTLTRKIKEAGKLIDIPLLDHIILTSQNGYFSFADNGIL